MAVNRLDASCDTWVKEAQPTFNNAQRITNSLLCRRMETFCLVPSSSNCSLRSKK